MIIIIIKIERTVINVELHNLNDRYRRMTVLRAISLSFAHAFHHFAGSC